MARKLDKLTRRWLEQAFERRYDAAIKIKHDALLQQLQECALRRLKAKYDAAQADMPILLKYKLAMQVERISFSVYDPKQNAWPDRVGIDVDMPGYMLPGSYNSASFYLGGYAAQGDHPAHEDHNSADWLLAREIVLARRTWERNRAQALNLFSREIRSTSSWSVLVARFPWIAEEFPDDSTENS